MSSTLSPQLYLASQSARRRELLTQIGVSFESLDVDVAEDLRTEENPKDFVVRLAEEKTNAGWHSPQRVLNIPVLGADTIVVIDGQILGKPQDREQAATMLELLAGRTHQVLTAICVGKDLRNNLRLSSSHVKFKDITYNERQWYLDTGEFEGKAGGYAIQGHAAVFIERLEGSYSGVMGLPLFETYELLTHFAVEFR